MRLLAASLLIVAVPSFAQQATTWRFDNLTHIGAASVTTLGHPQVIDTSIGKAIHFEGTGALAGADHGHPTGDAVVLDMAPLAGFSTYTFEVIFRPSSKGAPAQRFFHQQDANSQSRRMFELRIVNNQWCLDTVAIDATNRPTPQLNTPNALPGETKHAVIMNCDAAHLHPLDQWYAVAATYDGHTLRAYVNGQLQGELPVTLTPLPAGTTSVGTRIDHRDFFTGDVYSARFTPSVLRMADFLTAPTAP
jgi:hypothetical protein